jgi:DNA polymerase III subunit beta
MKFTVTAGAFANALALATLFGDDRRVKRNQALEAVHLTPDGASVKISANVLDHALELTVSAAVEEGGTLALSGARLAALAGGFPSKAGVTIQADGPTARVACDRSHFRLPAMAVENLPARPTLAEENGCVELAREEVIALFARPLFAASAEQTRYYLCGVQLHDADDGLVAVATDGHRLVRVTIPGAAGLSADHRVIVPTIAVKLITRLLTDNNKSIEIVRLARSKTLFAVEGPGFRFVTKLIDGTYPDYRRLIPKPSGSFAIVDRRELARALGRIAAVVDPQSEAMRLVGLRWSDGESALHLCIPGWPDLADDVLDAEVASTGKVAVQILHLAEIVAEIEGERIHIDTNGNGGPMLVTDPDDPNFLMLQMPCAWPFENATAA